MSARGPVDVVIPTLRRASLATLLQRLADDAAGLGTIVVVDDRCERAARGDLDIAIPSPLRGTTRVVRSGGRGPAAARNAGWRTTDAPWVLFLDDDVVPDDGWAGALHQDIASAAPGTGAVAAELHVPLPSDRRPTDRERQVKALEDAGWITADLVVRRDLLESIDGFDERFPRAHREDTDFALRAQRAGWAFEHGRRRTRHPVQPAPWWHSIAAQRGNRDDVLMHVLHRWLPDRSRRRRHLWITGCAAAVVIATMTGRRRVALAAAAGWLTGTLEFFAARVLPGPRTAREVATMAATSIVIPPVAVTNRWHAKLTIWRRGVPPARRGTPLIG